MTEGVPFLSLRDVTKTFGGVKALDNLSLNVDKGTIVGVIGPNGSGKSTMLNVIMGMHNADGGSICYRGEPITHLAPHMRARMGVGMVFQITRVFREMTVMENMLVVGSWSGISKARLIDKAGRLLEFVGIPTGLNSEKSGNISGGQQKLLELAMALMAEPDLLLADEPTAGIHANLKSIILQAITKQVKEGLTVIFVSHDIPTVMDICERVVVLDAGRLIADGTPEEVSSDINVIEAYLGV